MKAVSTTRVWLFPKVITVRKALSMVLAATDMIHGAVLMTV